MGALGCGLHIGKSGAACFPAAAPSPMCVGGARNPQAPNGQDWAASGSSKVRAPQGERGWRRLLLVRT